MTTLASSTPTAAIPAAADPPLLRPTRVCALLGAALGLISLVMVLWGEVSGGADFMTSVSAELAAGAAFAGSCLLVVGMLGPVLRHAHLLGRPGRIGLLVLVASGASTAGASASLLVATGIAERMPDVATDPPLAVPLIFILSGLVMGVSLIAVVLSVRAAVPTPSWLVRTAMVAAVVAMAPLPSRWFLVGLVCAALTTLGTGRDAKAR